MTPSGYLGRCRGVEVFEKLNRLGEGTYGTVYRARDTETGDIVALKKVRIHAEKEGFPRISLREIRLLKRLRHPNIVELQEVACGRQPGSVFLVFEYCEHDVGALLDLMERPFSQPEGVLKLADFGLAREFVDGQSPITQNVVTLWYRAPELLLGAKRYTMAVDMWSVGCNFGELLLKRPLLPGKCEEHQLQLTCGAKKPMGGQASQPVQKVTGSVLRKAGEPLNTLGYQVVHEKTVFPTGTKPVRVTVCRCWQSLRFPLCDNTSRGSVGLSRE
eukprot:g17471.t1